ncbi:hypothetical protein BO82DRAFT_405767 [Aspergillus uvarum CBS 121591]|uniref:Transcription factor domain-containing protein n=1 Tax=Aspergillus uvarum CBS 121591 TaxID=1448315 RepID=A0A319CQU5_9EURO|nr:hypothetical protein BO82DRAFT_405767 [Aspergillus uvarum CBS 121591]PYH77898.1 hypothetical protein BO82DRAFT_405767 [Aspergillus uvarum CBS 121591]
MLRSLLLWKLTIGTEGEPSFVGPLGGISFPGVTVDAPLAREPDLSHTSCETEPTRCDVTDAAVEDQLIEYFMQHVASYYGFLDPRELRQMGNLCNEEDIRFYRQAASDLAQRAAVVQCASRPRELTVLSLSVLAGRELNLGQENMGWMYISGPEKSSLPFRRVNYLHMSYYDSSLLIHRPFLRQAAEEQQGLRSHESISAQMATQTVRDAAKAFAQLARLHHRRIGDCRQAPPFLIQHLLTAEIMFLSQATAAVKQGAGRRPCNDLKECLAALEEMQESWPLKAHRGD